MAACWQTRHFLQLWPSRLQSVSSVQGAAAHHWPACELRPNDPGGQAGAGEMASARAPLAETQQATNSMARAALMVPLFRMVFTPRLFGSAERVAKSRWASNWTDKAGLLLNSRRPMTEPETSAGSDPEERLLSSWLRAPWLRRGLIAAIVAVYAVGVGGLHLWVMREELEEKVSVPVDDTYIHLQYAREMARGNWFSYQPGEGYSTGCTSPLYIMLLAVPYLLGAGAEDMVLLTLVFGCIWLGATTLLLLRLGRLLHNPAAGRVAAALWATSGFVWFCFYSGMETGLYLTMLAGVLCLFVSWTDRDRWRTRAPLMALAALLPVTRPEGAFLLATLLLVVAARLALRWWAARATEQPAPLVRGLVLPLVWWLPTLLPGALYHGANRVITGTFTTAGAMSKSLLVAPYFEPHQRAVQYVSQVFETARTFLTGNDPLFLTLAVTVPGLMAVVALWLREQARRDAGVWVLMGLWTLLAVLVASAHFIRIAAWPRYYLPFLMMVVFGAGVAMTWLADALRQRWLAAAAAVVLVFFQGDATVRWMKTYQRDIRVIHKKQAEAGRAVRKLRGKVRVMVCDAGAIPYISEKPSFDIVGLTTPLRFNYFRHGAGSRFELFETIPKNKRPTHVAAYDFCLWPGARGATMDMFHNMVIAPVAESGAGSGHHPGPKYKKARVVDSVDVADLKDEAAHGYRWWPPGKIRDNIIHRGVLGAPGKLVSDGGRLVKEWERFSFTAEPGRPVTMVARFTSGMTLNLLLSVNGVPRVVRLARSRGTWQQLEIRLPGKQIKRHNRVFIAPRPVAKRNAYHSYHYFFLQK